MAGGYGATQFKVGSEAFWVSGPELGTRVKGWSSGGLRTPRAKALGQVGLQRTLDSAHEACQCPGEGQQEEVSPRDVLQVEDALPAPTCWPGWQCSD